MLYIYSGRRLQRASPQHYVPPGVEAVLEVSPSFNKLLFPQIEQAAYLVRQSGIRVVEVVCCALRTNTLQYIVRRRDIHAILRCT